MAARLHIIIIDMNEREYLTMVNAVNREVEKMSEDLTAVEVITGWDGVDE